MRSVADRLLDEAGPRHTDEGDCGNPDVSLIVARVSPIYSVSSEMSGHNVHAVTVAQPV